MPTYRKVLSDPSTSLEEKENCLQEMLIWAATSKDNQHQLLVRAKTEEEHWPVDDLLKRKLNAWIRFKDDPFYSWFNIGHELTSGIVTIYLLIKFENAVRKRMNWPRKRSGPRWKRFLKGSGWFAAWTAVYGLAIHPYVVGPISDYIEKHYGRGYLIRYRRNSLHLAFANLDQALVDNDSRLKKRSAKKIVQYTMELAILYCDEFMAEVLQMSFLPLGEQMIHIANLAEEYPEELVERDSPSRRVVKASLERLRNLEVEGLEENIVTLQGYLMFRDDLQEMADLSLEDFVDKMKSLLDRNRED